MLPRSSLVYPSAFGAIMLAATLLPVAPAAASDINIPAAITATASAVPPIVVTEIVANNDGYEHYEYVEIHNTTSDAIDLAAEGYSSPTRMSTPTTPQVTRR